MRQRCALEQHRIGGIGTGAARACDQILQQVECGARVLGHLGHRISGHFQMGLPDPGSP